MDWSGPPPAAVAAAPLCLRDTCHLPFCAKNFVNTLCRQQLTNGGAETGPLMAMQQSVFGSEVVPDVPPVHHAGQQQQMHAEFVAPSSDIQVTKSASSPLPRESDSLTCALHFNRPAAHMGAEPTLQRCTEVVTPQRCVDI